MKVVKWIKKLSFAAVTTAMLATMVLVPAAPAMAVLIVGPPDPLTFFQGNANTGFPQWYQDQQGTKVTLRNALNAYPVDGASLPDGPTAGNAFSQQVGFTAEAFYWMAGPDFANPAGLGLVEFAIEAVNLDEGASGVGGQESVMSRTRIRLDVLTPGTVTITTPYGTRIFPGVTVVPGRPDINFTEDIGAIPRDFATAATGSTFTNLIRPVTPPIQSGLIGDGVFSGPATVGIGGPQAVVTITGGGLNIVANQWTVAGHLFPDVAPVASFTRNPATPTVAQGTSVAFTDTSINGPSTWLWNFGDNVTSQLQNPTHVYNIAGNFTASLNASNAAGADPTPATSLIQVTPAAPVAVPVSAFIANPTTGEAPLAVQFNDLSTGIPTGWFWSFGDGTTLGTAQVPSTSPNPSHTYAAPGTFAATLVARNALGPSTVAATRQITVTAPVPFPPIASFTANPPAGALVGGFLDVAFTDTTRGVPTTWSWNFGDGSPVLTGSSPALHKNPTHRYTAAGTFPVTLTASNALGAGVTSQTVTVAAVLPPTPSIAVAITAVQPGPPRTATITFSWADVAGETGYVIEHATSAAFGASINHVHGLGPNITTFVHPLDAAETAGTNFFRIFSLNGAVRSAASNALAVTIAAPPAPAAPAASVTSNTSVTLRWTAPVGANQIRIERRTGTTGAFTPVDADPVAAGQQNVAAGLGTFTVTGLSANTTFQFQLVALNAVDPVGTAASTSPAITVATAAPNAPTSPAAVAPSTTQVRVTWVDPAGASTITVERSTGAGAFATVGTPVSAGVQLFVDTAVTPGTTYRYQLIANNGVGPSAPSAAVTVTVPAPVIPPPPVGDGGGSGGGGGGGGAPTTTIVSLTGLSGTLTINSSTGAASSAATLTNAAGTVSLSVPSGSVLKTSAGANLGTMTVSAPATIPAAPSGRVIIMTQDFGPDGATFNPALTLTLGYSDANLPARVTEASLSMMKWTGSAWVDVAGSSVNAAANTVSGSISTFSIYGIAGTQAAPSPQLTTAPPATTTRPPATAARPTVTITAPANNATVSPGAVTVTINTGNFQIVAPGQTNVAGQGHVHYYIDSTIPTEQGKPAVLTDATKYKASQSTSNVWENVTPGTHTFGVQLVNINHTPLDPPVTATVTVTVGAAQTTTTAVPTSPTPSEPTGGGTNWGLIIGIAAAVVVVIVIITLVARKKPAAS